MFYCNECGEKAGWPTNHWQGSYGPCELCGETRNCNDIPSRNLPVAKPKPKT